MASVNCGAVRSSEKSAFWDVMGYVSLLGLFVGQALIGINFIAGEIAYVITDIIIVARTFSLKRPCADKVKDISLLILTIIVLISKL